MGAIKILWPSRMTQRASLIVCASCEHPHFMCSCTKFFHRIFLKHIAMRLFESACTLLFLRFLGSFSSSWGKVDNLGQC